MTLPTRTDRDVPDSPADPPAFVLLVDDDQVGRSSIASLLGVAGHPCVDVGTATEALDLCDCRRPRLVITDLCMPGLDGRGLGRLLRGRYPGLSLILITAEPLDDRLVRELLETFDAVLAKPIDCDRLLDRVSDLDRHPYDRSIGPAPAPHS